MLPPGAASADPALPARGWRSALPAAGIATTLGWLLLGDLGIAMRDRVALPGALELLRQHGASDTATSLLLATVPALLALVVVPWLGWHSDRTGRRRPFLCAAATAGGLALLALAGAPALARLADAALGAWSPGLRACTLATFCLAWTLFDCAALTALAMFTGLVSDFVPPALLGRFYAAVRIVGLGVGIGFNTWVFALTERWLAQVLGTAALLFALPLLAMCLAVRERPARPSGAVAPPRARLRDCAAHPRCALAVAVFVLASVTFAPFNTFYQHYAHAAGVPKATLGALTAAGYAVSIVSAFALGTLVDRRGALPVSAALMMLYCGVAALGYGLVRDAAGFELFYLAHVALSGAWFTAAASLPMVLFPADRFVQFNAGKDLLVLLANLVVTTVQGPLLDLSGHDYRLTLASAACASLLCVACMTRLARAPVQPTGPAP